jgi:hypothetical protein
MKVSFTSGAVAANIVTIVAGTATGFITVVGTAGDLNVYNAAATNVVFSATSSLGDRADLISNGTKWQVQGNCTVGGITFS